MNGAECARKGQPVRRHELRKIIIIIPTKRNILRLCAVRVCVWCCWQAAYALIDSSVQSFWYAQRLPPSTWVRV